MILKHVLKHFSKTNSEDLLFPRPLREREELLSEQSELSNSGEGCVSCAKHTETDLPSNRLSVLTTLKHKLDCFAFARNDDVPYPLPLREREELLCERSELSNSGEGCKDLPSPDRHPLPGEGKFVIQNNKTHPCPPLEKEGVKVSCAKHTEKDLSSNRLSVLTTSKKAAFTLAEVLITLAIIGVVAAVTMPVLIQKAEEKIVVNKVIKTYSILTNAYNSLLAEYGPPNTWEGISKSENITNFNNNLVVANYFAKQLKLSNICNSANLKCHHNKTIIYGGLVPGLLDPASSSAHIQGYAGILNDMTVSFSMASSSCNGWADFSWDSVNKNPNSPYYHACGFIYVDINGTRSPNVYGRDLFQFIFTDRKIVPLGTPPTPYSTLKTSCNGTWKTSWDGSTNGSYCAAWIIINKNMDYLRKEVKW